MNISDNNIGLGEFWWAFYTKKRIYQCSDALTSICGISDNCLSVEYFMAMVHPKYKSNIVDGIKAFLEGVDFDQTYLLLTKYGYRWVNSKTTKSKVDENGEYVIYGYISFLSDDEVELYRQEESNGHLDELIDRYSIISASLMDLMYQKNTNVAINKALDNLLVAFNGDRTYIFEYDLATGTQSCAYEVVKDASLHVNSILQSIDISETEWWTKKLLVEKSPIICGDIEEIKNCAKTEYSLLKDQGIKSVMIMPLISRNGIRGYIGVDMVENYHTWSNTDIQWFQSFSNILSLCLDLKRSEEQAKAERERYVELYKNMPVGFIRIKLLYDDSGDIYDYMIININSVGCKFFNVSEEEVLNVKGSEKNIYNKDYFENQLNLFNSIAKSSGVQNNMFNQVGDSYFDNTIYSVDQDEVVILVKDVTESTIATRALYKSEATLQNIYNNIPVGIEMYDKDGFLVSVNNKEKEIFGFEKNEDVLGVNLFDNPNIPKKFLDDLKNNKSSWCDFFYGFSKLNGYYESEKRGEKHIVLKGTILYDHNHNVENFMLIVLDDTEHAQISQELKEFKMIFNSIAEFAEIGMCKWSCSDNTINGTDQWYDNLCIEKTNIHNIADAYINAHPDDSLTIQRNFADMLSGKITNFKKEIRIGTGNGDWKWLRCSYKVADFSSEDKVMEIISINIDITELKRTEAKLIEAKQKAEESDRLKSSFIANMSHEIRTPLNSIVGFAELLVDESLATDEKEEYISIIKQNNEVLLQLISDILDISKIESGMIDLTIGSVDVLATCIDMITCFSSNSGVPLLLEPGLESCIISTDKMRLIQIFKNLIGNALKFTKEGSVSIGYTVTENTVTFSVKDTGIGIPKESHKTIFDRFVKTNNFIQGTGLGLSICKSIVEKMEGEIWVESEPGVGSCFYFSIPKFLNI